MWDEDSVEVAEAEEASHILHRGQDRPIHDAFDFGRVLRLAGLAIIRAYIWQYCAYVIRVHWMPQTGAL